MIDFCISEDGQTASHVASSGRSEELKSAQSTGCSDCFFGGEQMCLLEAFDVDTHCNSEEREDGVDIIWVKSEGE